MDGRALHGLTANARSAQRHLAPSFTARATSAVPAFTSSACTMRSASARPMGAAFVRADSRQEQLAAERDCKAFSAQAPSSVE